MNTSRSPASAPSRVRFSFRLQCEKPGSYRAGRCGVRTPPTCLKDGSNKRDCRRNIHLTHFGLPVSPIFWRTTAHLKPLSESPATPTVAPRNSMIGAGRRFSSRTWRGFVTDACRERIWDIADLLLRSRFRKCPLAEHKCKRALAPSNGKRCVFANEAGTQRQHQPLKGY